MNYTLITEENVEKVATLYMNHYNQHSGGCWTYEKAYKRIHQMVTMEDSLCLMQEDDNDIPTGLVIGFLESYDDFTFYYLDEILIFGEYQNKGYGRLLLQEVEQRVRERGAQMIELVCPDDAHHMHFYGGFGMAEATNLRLMKNDCKSAVVILRQKRTNWNSTISGILERVRLHPYIPAGRERFSEIIAKPVPVRYAGHGAFSIFEI